MRSIFLLLFFSFLLIGHLSSQTRRPLTQRDTTRFNNRLYKQELGIGIGISWVTGSYSGGTLIWKIRDDRGKLIPVSYANNWRFQASIGGNGFTGYRDTISYNSIYRYYSIQPSNFQNYLNVNIGRERVNFFNRYNFYYGWEAGPSLYHSRRNEFQSYYYINSLGQIENGVIGTTTRELGLGVNISAFVGLKYHINNHISLSFESAFGMYYTFNRRQISALRFALEKGEHNWSSAKWYQRFGYNLQYLRFITLNYRFKTA